MKTLVSPSGSTVTVDNETAARLGWIEKGETVPAVKKPRRGRPPKNEPPNEVTNGSSDS